MGATGWFGFCRQCGAPLCSRCAMTQKLVSERRRTLIVPLLVVRLIWSSSITSRVSFCRSCLTLLNEEEDERLQRTATISLVIALGIFIPMVVAFGPNALAGAAILGGLIASGAAFPAYFLLRFIYERKLRPTCPVCGRDAMRLISRNFSNAGIENGVLPDVIDCTCGYRGPRAPLDGLWVFVETNGPGPLAGSPVEKMANASRIARDARK